MRSLCADAALIAVAFASLAILPQTASAQTREGEEAAGGSDETHACSPSAPMAQI